MVARWQTDRLYIYRLGQAQEHYPHYEPWRTGSGYTQGTNGGRQIFKLDVNSGIQTQLTHVGWNSGGDWFDPVYALPVEPKPQLLTTTWGDIKKR